MIPTRYKIGFKYLIDNARDCGEGLWEIPVDFNDNDIIKTEVEKVISSLEKSCECRIIVTSIWLETLSYKNLAGILSGHAN